MVGLSGICLKWFPSKFWHIDWAIDFDLRQPFFFNNFVHHYQFFSPFAQIVENQLVNPCIVKSEWHYVSPIIIESFRFQDEYHYEYEIFSILSGFRANVVVAGDKLSNVGSFIILWSEEGVTSFTKMKLSGKSIFWEDAKKLEVKSRTRSRSCHWI